MITGKKIFITGGSGFIGSHLVERFSKNNEIVIFDNFHRDSLFFLGKLSNVKVKTSDVLLEDELTKAMDGCQIVIHLASIAGVDEVMENPIETMNVSYIGTKNVLNACIENNVEQMIFLSTSEVFGDNSYQSLESDVSVLGPVIEGRWTYAISKLAAEHLVYSYYRKTGLPTFTIRPFNVFGPRQMGHGAVRDFIVQALKGSELVVKDDGSQIRSWCYINDMVDAIDLCMHALGTAGETFSIGNPKNTISVDQLANKIITLTGSKSKIVYEENENVDIQIRVPNIDKAKKLLKFLPKWGLDDGLKQAIEWYRHV